MREVKVLIITGKTNVSTRQLPGCVPTIVRGDRSYQMLVNKEIKDPDIIVVRNKYIKKKLHFKIARENTILMLSEPKSVVNFPKPYRDQFGMLYSCQENIAHSNVIYGPALLPWFVGVENRNGNSLYSKTYDDFANSSFPEKTKQISIITSNKSFTWGHQKRLEFALKVKKRYGDKVDVWGRGFRDFGDKWDALAPYKFTISIENNSSKYYWTEKLSDPFLTGTYPIYYGCTNATDYFPTQSFSTINIDKPKQSFRLIDKLLDSDAYEKSLPYLEQAKQLTLDKFNMFQIIADCCDSLNPDAPKQKITLRPSLTALDPKNLYNSLITRNILKIRNWYFSKEWQKVLGESDE